jgi:hypothetical protein
MHHFVLHRVRDDKAEGAKVPGESISRVIRLLVAGSQQ